MLAFFFLLPALTLSHADKHLLCLVAVMLSKPQGAIRRWPFVIRGSVVDT